ncbi:MAG TPA: glucose-6-phosphate isomerase [Chthoniobacterales bacterium]
MLPTSLGVNPQTGLMSGFSRRYEKRLQDLADIYFDGDAFTRLARENSNLVTYEVYDFRPSDRPGDLIFGTSILYPGRVGDEFFMTRGHVHARADRPEIYYCQEGQGLMLMESPDGRTETLEMTPQTIAYVPPFWIHRSVNLGPGTLVTVFCYPSDAGQDYEIIARAGGMRHLVVADKEPPGWRLAENPRYTPRTPEEVARVVATGVTD